MEKVKLLLLKDNPELAAFVHYTMDENCQFFYSPGIPPHAVSSDSFILESTYDLFRREEINGNSLALNKRHIFLEYDAIPALNGNLPTLKSIPDKKIKHFDQLVEQRILSDENFNAIIGNCDEIKQLKKELCVVSEKECKVLFCGESGTGKSLLARVLHKTSLRKDEKYISVNVGALPKDLIESTLFGTVKGAFTDARDRKGLIHLAEHGTIFLDEIGEMPLSCQTKLLHTLDDGCFRKVGSEVEEKSDARFIFATNAKLKELVKKKLFREDLYWRIAEFTINVPPLRKRDSDIILLAEYFLQQENSKCRNKIKFFTEEAKQKLIMHSWPGNIRELKSCINIASIFAQTEKIDADDIHLENDF